MWLSYWTGRAAAQRRARWLDASLVAVVRSHRFMERPMTFQGFGTQALPFFKALAFHQTKEWFEDNRETYESAVKAPMGDLVEDIAARLGKAGIPIKGDRRSSLFRLHRDVRFSKNKDPYKTNAGLLMTRRGSKNGPGLLYFQPCAERCV